MNAPIRCSVLVALCSIGVCTAEPIVLVESAREMTTYGGVFNLATLEMDIVADTAARNDLGPMFAKIVSPAAITDVKTEAGASIASTLTTSFLQTSGDSYLYGCSTTPVGMVVSSAESGSMIILDVQEVVDFSFTARATYRGAAPMTDVSAGLFVAQPYSPLGQVELQAKGTERVHVEGTLDPGLHVIMGWAHLEGGTMGRGEFNERADYSYRLVIPEPATVAFAAIGFLLIRRRQLAK